MSKRSLSCILLVFLALAVIPLMGSHTNIVGINTASTPLFNGDAMVYNTTIYSAADGSIGRSESQSVQFKIESAGTFSTTITVQTSLDEINWATPLAGGTIASNISDSDWHSTDAAIPVCKKVRFLATDNVTPTNNPTITLIFGAQ